MFSCHSSSSHYSMQGFIFILFHFFFVNKLIHFYMWACFLFSFQNKCDQNTGTWGCRFLNNSITVQLSLTYLTTLFRVVKEIAYLRNHLLGWFGDILEPPSAVFSVCRKLYQKLVFFWKVYDSRWNWKFINGYPDMTIWILVQCTAFLIEKNMNYHKGGHFLDILEILKILRFWRFWDSEEKTVQKILE